MRRREQGLTLFTAILWLVGMVVAIQLWLLTAELEALLSGHLDVLIPAAVASLLLFGVCGGLLLCVLKLDARIRKSEGEPE
jgi:hypothetical protein